MDYQTDEKNHRVTVRGTKEEMDSFAYALEETVSKGHLKGELEELIDNISKRMHAPHQFNLSQYLRFYYEPSKIIVLVNGGDWQRQAFFPLLKQYCETAYGRVRPQEEEGHSDGRS